MSMSEWAKEEVRLACERERKASEAEEGCWDYGCACYESALKAFESLCGDGHSGFSIQMTKQILNRLIDHKPLTPIEDTDDIWSERIDRRENYTIYQCKRMSSFFKDVYDDGTVKYHDNNRLICVDVHNHDNCWSNGFVSRLYNEMFPITMPYIPANDRVKVYCKEFLTDKKNGDFDTMGILYAIQPDGEKVNIDRYFKEGENSWDEITFEEYDNRRWAAETLKVVSKYAKM